MWILFEEIFLLVLVIGIVVEVLLPTIFGKPLFPSFRSKPTPVVEKKESSTKNIDDLVEELKTKVVEEEKETETIIKDSEELIKENKEKLDKVQDIKNKTENL